MNNFWVFGCSHATSDHNLVNHDECWTSMIAQTLKYNEINLARSSYSNDSIFLSILENLKNFNPDDKIFVLLSFPERLRIDSKDILPQHTETAHYYKIINDDEFFTTKFLQTVIAIKFLFNKGNFDYKIGFVDPTLLLKLFKDSSIKHLIKDDHTVFFPKLTLTKSFELGADNRHLSAKGHVELYKFLVNLLCEPT